MMDFLHNLYADPNFPLYLGIVIVVLLIAFFALFFLGKKESAKLDETKKLDTIDNNTFSETTEPISLEVVSQPEPQVDEAPIMESKSEEMPINPPEEVISLTAKEELGSQISVPIDNELPTNNQHDEAYNTEEMKNDYNDISNKIDNDLKEMEDYQTKPLLNEEVEPPISIPSVEEEKTPDEVNNENKNSNMVNDVFSSVYAPKKDPVLFDDTAEIELPKLK